MRNIIVALSAIILALSGIVTFKAFGIPVRNMPAKGNPQVVQQQGASPQMEEMLEKFVREQAENRAMVQRLQTTITKLEDRLSSSREAARPAGPVVAAQKRGRVLGVIGDGEFHPGQDGMSENMKKAIDAFASDILQFPDLLVIIEGHTDKTPIRSSGGRYSDNLDLSFLRAKAVAKLLEKKGVPPERISVVGYGYTRPIASNDTEEGKAKNRRVEIRLAPRES